MIKQIVEKYKNLMYDAEKYIWQNPETGFKEYKTSAYLETKMQELGYDLIKADNIPGFYTVIDTKRPGPEVLILAELDSVICYNHKDCNKETGAVHSCGHHLQTSTLLGVAGALTEPEVLNELSGKIRLCFVPAEELLEISYRTELQKQGVIKYLTGKTEFLHRGYFDGVDMAFMVHAGKAFTVRKGSIGAISKTVEYKGVASHAGGAPHLGVNALYAATCGLNAINAARETFTESDIVRVHPIITRGGDMVNAVPDKVLLESYVRAKTFEAIVNNNQKVNRALIGSALSLGANIEINDTPAFSPLLNDDEMMLVAKEAFELSYPELKLNYDPSAIGSGCTDMGDLSTLMPVVHPYSAGVVGASHGSEYYVTDLDSALLKSAVWQLTILKLLLKNGAVRAKNIIEKFKPKFASKKEFLEFVDSLSSSGEKIVYNGDTALVKLK